MNPLHKLPIFRGTGYNVDLNKLVNDLDLTVVVQNSGGVQWWLWPLWG